VSSNLAKINSEALPDGGERYVLTGDWRNHSVAPVLKDLDQFEKSGGQGKVEIDLSGISEIDTAGAWLIRRLMTAKSGEGQEASLSGGNGTIEELIGALPETTPAPPAPAADKRSFFDRVFTPPESLSMKSAAIFTPR